MKRFKVPCSVGGRTEQVDVYVGNPRSDSHPLQNQSRWLSEERGASISQEVMESFAKLHRLALDHDVDFEDLCVHAMEEIQARQAAKSEAENTPAADEHHPPEKQQAPLAEKKAE